MTDLYYIANDVNYINEKSKLKSEIISRSQRFGSPLGTSFGGSNAPRVGSV